MLYPSHTLGGLGDDGLVRLTFFGRSLGRAAEHNDQIRLRLRRRWGQVSRHRSMKDLRVRPIDGIPRSNTNTSVAGRNMWLERLTRDKPKQSLIYSHP